MWTHTFLRPISSGYLLVNINISLLVLVFHANKLTNMNIYIKQTIFTQTQPAPQQPQQISLLEHYKMQFTLKTLVNEMNATIKEYDNYIHNVMQHRTSTQDIHHITTIHTAQHVSQEKHHHHQSLLWYGVQIHLVDHKEELASLVSGFVVVQVLI